MLYSMWCSILHQVRFCFARPPGLSTIYVFWFRVFVQWDVSTMTVVSCPSHLLGGLWAFFPYWSRAHARTTTLGGNGTGGWTSTTAVWTQSLPRSMSFVTKTGIIDLQTERWGRGCVSGTYWAWTGWRFLTHPCAPPMTALCVSVQGPNCKAQIHLTSFNVEQKSNLWSKLLKWSCWIQTGASRTAAYKRYPYYIRYDITVE